MNRQKAFLTGMTGATALLSLFLVVSLPGCSQPQDKLIKETLAQSDPAQVRAAVLPLFAKYHDKTDMNGYGQIIPDSDIPKEVKSLPLLQSLITNAPQYILDGWANTNRSALLFATGGGFGHWGIVVCLEENDREFDNVKSYKYWKDGIYIYEGE
jgi:hypothetical protein